MYYNNAVNSTINQIGYHRKIILNKSKLSREKFSRATISCASILKCYCTSKKCVSTLLYYISSEKCKEWKTDILNLPFLLDERKRKRD